MIDESWTHFMISSLMTSSEKSLILLFRTHEKTIFKPKMNFELSFGQTNRSSSFTKSIIMEWQWSWPPLNSLRFKIRNNPRNWACLIQETKLYPELFIFCHWNFLEFFKASESRKSQSPLVRLTALEIHKNWTERDITSQFLMCTVGLEGYLTMSADLLQKPPDPN